MSSSVVNDNFQIYYSGQYWNDLPQVKAYINTACSGESHKDFFQHFQENYCASPFQHALVLNCGNGWVDRLLIDRGIAQKITAFDYSHDLLKEAESARNSREITYFQADANQVDFDADQYDLIVNHAALHHVQYINRLCKILAKSLKPEGVFLNFDYVGPGRNQYPSRQWRLIKKENSRLAEFARKERLVAPHLPTMLHVDPTEAIHSDLILECVKRYFDITLQKDIGGGIAYEILTHNPRLNKLGIEELQPVVSKLLEADRKYTQERKVPVLFSYFVAKSNKDAINNKIQCDLFQREEVLREKKALEWGGVYNLRQYLRMKRHGLYIRVVGKDSYLTRQIKMRPWLLRLFE